MNTCKSYIAMHDINSMKSEFSKMLRCVCCVHFVTILHGVIVVVICNAPANEFLSVF